MKSQRHAFSRYAVAYADITALNAAGSLNAFNQIFTLSNVSGYAEFTTLFDFYRIVSVSISITPSGQYITNDRTVTGAGGLDTSGNGYWIPPMLYMVLDYNDATALPSIPVAEEYQSCKLIPYIKRETKLKFTPAVNEVVDQGLGVGSVGVGTRFAPWIATSNPNVVHYGLKYLALNPNTFNVGSSYATNRWQVRTKYNLEFKNVN